MKLCLVSKYPPIEGGVSSKVYWLAKALGERGHEVHVVTNALEVEDEYREELDQNDPNFRPKNVYIHSTDPAPTIQANPSHIPFSKMYCEKLANLTINVVEDYDIELIDPRYLVPYGVAGYLAKSLIGTPQVISHAGSDLQRLYPSQYLNKLLSKVVQAADGIITDSATAPFFHNQGILASKIFEMPQITVDTQAFNPNVSPFNLTPYMMHKKYSSNVPVIAFIGKVTHHFETKGIPELLKACSMIDKEFQLLFVANGKKLDDLKTLVRQANLTEKTSFLPFVPPWQMPSILKACTCIVAIENSFSPTLSYHVPSTPAEAMATGRCVIMSKELHLKEPYKQMGDGKDLLVVNSEDAREVKEILEKLIKNPTLAESIGKNSRDAIIKNEQIMKYVEKTIQLYRSVLSK